jgi:hypothetical protein
MTALAILSVLAVVAGAVPPAAAPAPASAQPPAPPSASAASAQPPAPAPASAASAPAPSAAPAPAAAEKPPVPAGKAATGPAPAAPSAPADPRDPAVRRAEALAQTRRALAAPVAGIALEKTPLKDALARLAEAGKFNLVFDPALKASGLDPAARPVTARLAGLSYDDAIYLLLPGEFGYRVEPGYVLVSTLDKSWLPLEAAVYRAQLKQAEPPPLVVVGAGLPQVSQANAGQIGASYRGPNPSQGSVTASQQSERSSGGSSTFIAVTPPDPVRDAPPEQVAAMVKRLVRHAADRRIAPWDDEGGPAHIEISRGRLIISQTEHGHRAIANLVPAAQ